MKKTAIILGLFAFCVQAVLAEGVEPAQTANDNRALISIQKQPANETQKQEISQNKWCIIIQVNGKVKESNERANTGNNAE